MSVQNKYGIWQTTALCLLRMAIGWHCLHEGMVKLGKLGGWSAYGYLAYAKGPFSGLFAQIAGNEILLAISNFSVKWCLAIFGALLMIGLFTRFSSLVLMGLIALFYLANPPFYGDSAFGLIALGAEGSYWIVNKNLIEILALWVVLAFENGQIPGLDVYGNQWTKRLLGRA